MRELLLSIGYDRWILPTLLFLPVIGAFLTWFHGIFEFRAGHVGRNYEAFARWLPFGIFLVEFILSLGLWWAYDPNGAPFQLTVTWDWIPDWGVHMSLGVDGISLFLIMMVTFLLPIAVLSSWTSIERAVHSYHALFLILTTGMLGVFMARDLVMFYFFWELVLIPMYLIIGVWGGPRRLYAATKFFLYTFIGSLFMLVAILYIGFQVGDAMFLAGMSPTHRPNFLFENAIAYFRPSDTEAVWLFLAFFAAFAVKVPIIPFHTWLPDAHVEAPTEGSVDLAAILLKMGTYGFIRIVLPLFPGIVTQSVLGKIIMVLGAVGVVYAALVAMVQDDWKKLIAYSSVSHMGFAVLGIFAVTVESLQGAMMVQLAHGLGSAALFLLIGILYERRHTRMLDSFGGLAKVMPLFAGFLMIATLSSIGLPGTFGFVGEFYVLIGAFGTAPLLVFLATIGVILSAVYMLWSIQRIIFNPLSNPENKHLPDMNWREASMLLPLCAMLVWFGVHPAPVLRRMEPSITRLVEQVHGRLPVEATGQVQIRIDDGGVPGGGEQPAVTLSEAR